MVVMMKLAHVDELSGGRKRFRRRFPKALVQVIGEERLQVAMNAREGAALVNEHAALMTSYDKIVAQAKRKAVAGGTLSSREHWQQVVAEAQVMVANVRGPALIADLGAYACQTSQSRHTVRAAQLTLLNQIVVQLAPYGDCKQSPTGQWIAVDFAAILPGIFEQFGLTRVLQRALT